MMSTEAERKWAEHEQAELARQAEWLRKEREKAQWEPKKAPPILGRIKKFFGSKG